MPKVVIIGGGWSGCAAAIAARNAGAEVVLLERTDLLLGCGLAGGIMRNNGRFTAAEELKCLGAPELVDLTDALSRHVNIDFPGHRHANLYDTALVEPAVRQLLYDKGVDIRFVARAVGVSMDEPDSIRSVSLADGTTIHGDAFIETTGSAGSMGNCARYGNGCTMCVLRCPSFGPRVSLSRMAGCEESVGLRDGETYGSFSGSCELNKATLSPEIRQCLAEKGVAILPLQRHLVDEGILKLKACKQYAIPEFKQNLILLDTGARAKMMMPFFPLEKLRKIKGLERAMYEFSGGISNSVRFMARTHRDNALKAQGLTNLFCAGEKAGLFVGHTEAMATGSLAGWNGVQQAKGLPLLSLPDGLAIGDLIRHENLASTTLEGLNDRYTFSGGNYFKRLKRLGLYTTDPKAVESRVRAHGLHHVFLTAHEKKERPLQTMQA
ncbi:FAD-dependent oxidoreductase [Desulfoluna spongiiphila]|uniref:Glucose inhibited division protein A n=1 Tax=Desulfoluna spongiiphila TaxID=419481 RepID=A0A1G5HXS4_9BACT|nr:FAD-dependent oxidoreductase [Desulfoluna spongiiphila]SCY68602.1 Glucose inhibited division protein A [Desulfoluna spongiiphila]